MTDDNVVNIGDKKEQTTLCACIECGHNWAGHCPMAGPAPKCPECNSSKTIIDQLYEVPTSHVVFTCHCGNKYYKVCKAPDDSIYWMCAACGTTSN